MQVNTSHHQAVRDAGPGVAVNAMAPDGVIEGIEDPRYRFCLGVQWHPEFLIDPADRRIFDGADRGLRMSDEDSGSAGRRPGCERGERIAKWLARAGVASRRDAEKLLAEGRVKLNGELVDASRDLRDARRHRAGRRQGGRRARTAPGSGATTSRKGW